MRAPPPTATKVAHPDEETSKLAEPDQVPPKDATNAEVKAGDAPATEDKQFTNGAGDAFCMYYSHQNRSCPFIG